MNTTEPTPDLIKRLKSNHGPSFSRRDRTAVIREQYIGYESRRDEKSANTKLTAEQRVIMKEQIRRDIVRQQQRAMIATTIYFLLAIVIIVFGVFYIVK
ncbi:MAG: hypothetical protein RR931_05810 [Mucinivorans sp.]